MAPGESNLRTQIRSLPLYPLSYGASLGTVARPAERRGRPRRSFAHLGKRVTQYSVVAVGEVEAGVDRVQPRAVLVDRGRHIEQRVTDSAHDTARAEAAPERDLGDDVQLVLHDVEREAVEQDAVAVRDALGAEVDPPRHSRGRIDREEPAGVRLDDHEPRSVDGRVDAVRVEPRLELEVALDLERLDGALSARPPAGGEGTRYSTSLLESVNHALRLVTATSLTKVSPPPAASCSAASDAPVRASYTNALPVEPPATKSRPRSASIPIAARPCRGRTRTEPLPVRRFPRYTAPVGIDPT